METFKLETEYIELCQLLKSVGGFQSGGEAKMAIVDGDVMVDGEVEFRKKCKIRAGQRVQFDTLEIVVEGP